MARIKISITLPEDLLKRMGRADANRSACFAPLKRTRREAQDAEIINANADRLNRQALDVLEYQGVP